MATSLNDELTRMRVGIAEQTPFNIVVFDTTLRAIWANDSMARLVGVPAEHWVGRHLGEMAHGPEIPNVERLLERVLETGERVKDMEHPGSVLFGTSSARVWACSVFQIEDLGQLIGVALIVADVTGRSRDRERLLLLNEVGERIGSTLDITRTAEETLDLLVPRVGDAAHINLLSYVMEGGAEPSFAPDGVGLRLIVAAARWLPGRAVPAEIERGAISYLDPASLYFQRLLEGRTIFEPDLDATSEEFRVLMGSEFFARRFGMVRKAGIKGGMIVPISARGAILGTVAVFRAREPKITPQEVNLTRDVVRRSAMCLDNARVYSRERVIALELQRSLLPQSLDEPAGLELAYQYEPANMASEIGGDWFDVVHLPEGRVGLIVGDVTGHDIRAASRMGQLRTVTRTLAILGLSPVEVLTRLDSIVSEMGPEAGATCVYVTLHPETRRCVIARAGHPPPARVEPSGSVDFLDMPPGLPLGVGVGVFESVELELTPGTVLVLSTDGLIETRGAGIDTGMCKLARAIAEAHALPFSPTYASSLIKSLVADQEDDIAVLAVRITPTPRADRVEEVAVGSPTAARFAD